MANLWVSPIERLRFCNCKSTFCLKYVSNRISLNLFMIFNLSNFWIPTNHRIHVAAFWTEKTPIIPFIPHANRSPTSLTDFLSLSPFWRCCWEDEVDGTVRLFDEAKWTTINLHQNTLQIDYIAFEYIFDDWMNHHWYHELGKSTLAFQTKTKNEFSKFSIEERKYELNSHSRPFGFHMV